MSRLFEELEARSALSSSRLTEDDRRVMEEGIAELLQSGIVEHSIGVGTLAPEFELPETNGGAASLGAYLAVGPVVLNFYRGGWCPYCNLELRAFEATWPDIRGLGANLLAISPQLPDYSRMTSESAQLSFPVLSDVGNSVARRYGLVFSLPSKVRSVYQHLGNDLPATNGDHSFDLPVPATYVIRSDRVVAWRFADPDYRRRSEPDDVLAALRAL